MKRYILTLLLIVMVMIIGADAGVTARIGDWEYSQAELEEGFSAYLDYQRHPDNLSFADSLALFGQYFEEIIALNIYNNEIAERGIELSPLELEEEIIKNPPSGVMQIPDLMTDGRFDRDKYVTALQERPEFKLSIMKYSHDVYLYHKLLNVIKSEAQIDSARIQRDWMQQGASADAQIIFFDYTKLHEVQPEESEILALYDENREEYRRENGRSLYFVHFEGPSSRAGAHLVDKIRPLSEELHREAERMELPAAAEKLGYELSESHLFSAEDKIIRGMTRDPGLVRSSFASPVGTLLPAYESPMKDIFVCQIARQQDEYFIPYEVERPVLEIQARSLKRQNSMKDFVGNFIREHSSDEYLTAAREAGLNIIEVEKVGLESRLPEIGRVEALNRAILTTPEGSFSPLIQNYGFHYLVFVSKRHQSGVENWEQEKDTVLQAALQEAQNAHLDEWYLTRKAELEIIYPKELQHLAD